MTNKKHVLFISQRNHNRLQSGTKKLNEVLHIEGFDVVTMPDGQGGVSIDGWAVPLRDVELRPREKGAKYTQLKTLKQKDKIAQ